MENKRNQFSVRSPSRVPYRTKLLPRAPNGGVPGPPSHGEGRRTIISGVVKENEMSWISSPPHPRARADEAAVSTRSISACLRQYIHVLSASTSTYSPRVHPRTLLFMQADEAAVSRRNGLKTFATPASAARRRLGKGGVVGRRWVR